MNRNPPNRKKNELEKKEENTVPIPRKQIPYSPCYSTHPYIVRTRVFEAKKEEKNYPPCIVRTHV